MKMRGPALGILLAVSLLSCRNRPTEQAHPTFTQEFEKVIATQDHANRYLHKAVVPGLLDCWKRLEGAGTIGIQVAYRRDGDRWVAGTSSVRNSTLQAGQDEVALRCLQGAVRNTAFAVDQSDGDAREFVVNWSFPVPWPMDIKEVARMISTNPGGGGGCGGGPESPAPACFDCGYIPILGWSYCKKVCAGYTNCTAELNGCQMGPITPKCATVSPLGNQGGFVIY